MSDERHLRDLAERWELAPSQVAALARALEFLALDPRAPSSVRDAAAVDVHIADSLSALGLECVAGARVVADLGSGAGFPGPGARGGAGRRAGSAGRERRAQVRVPGAAVRARGIRQRPGRSRSRRGVGGWTWRARPGRGTGARAAGRGLRVRGAVAGDRGVARGVEGSHLGGGVGGRGAGCRAARAAWRGGGPQRAICWQRGAPPPRVPQGRADAAGLSAARRGRPQAPAGAAGERGARTREPVAPRRAIRRFSPTRTIPAAR